VNPWAFVILSIAIGCLIVAYRGTEDNVITAITGRPYGNTNLAA
jgi:hypothetical protein